MFVVLSSFSSIKDFFSNIADVFSGLVDCIPGFLQPLCLAFVVISAIFLVVGRD